MQSSTTNLRRGRSPGSQEPGNRLGALGMFASLIGGWILIPEIPSVPVSWTPTGTTLLILGVALAIMGLHHEWRGPRRWSALLPGLFLLAFTTAISWMSLQRTAGVTTESVAGLDVRTPRSDVTAAAVLAYADPTDREVLERLAVSLAKVGVAAGVAPTADVSAETFSALRDRWADLPAGALVFDEAGGELPALDALPIDFLAVLSAAVPEGLRLGADGPRLLGMYGFEDTVVHPHEHGQRLLAVFSQSGRPHGVQMMLGADHHLRSAQASGPLPPGFAPSLVERLAEFMSRPG